MTDVNNETSANQGDSRAASAGSGASGLPLRGLAMVLIAVAVLFGLWALYSFTQGGDDERAATGTSETVSESANGQAGTVTQDPTTAGAPAGGGAEGTDSPASATDAGKPAAGERPTSPAAAPNNGNVAASSAGAGASAGAAADGEISGADVKNVTVNVVNNSTITGLAESTYNDLRDRGYKVGEHGNLPEQELDNPLPETTVFYHPGDKVGQQAAEELAEQIADTYKVPTTTAPNIEQLPAETARPGNVTLALIGELAPRQ